MWGSASGVRACRGYRTADATSFHAANRDDVLVAEFGAAIGADIATLRERLATRRLWLVASAPEPEVCVSHPGWDEDLVVTTDAAWLAGWRLGRWSIGSGLRTERVRADGTRSLLRTLQRWGEVGRTFGG